MKPGWASPREREGTRQAILDAAKRIVTLRGEEALTLSAVAAEAGLARATLYGYFSSKRQLLDAVGAAPLEAAEAKADEQQEAMQPEPEQPVETSTPVEVSTASEVEREPAKDDYDSLMRKQAEALDHLAQRLIVPKSMMKEGTEAVITRLEARVGVVEQSHTALEKRVADEFKNLAHQAAAITEAAQQLQKRVEAFENRQQLALAELRLDVHNLVHPDKPVAPQRFSIAEDTAKAEPLAEVPARVETPVAETFTIESVTDTPSAEAKDAETPSPEVVEAPKAEGPEPLTIADLSSAEKPAEAASRIGYLSSARRAAMDAAQVTEKGKRKPSRKQWLDAWRWALGVMFLVAMGTGAFLLTLGSFAKAKPEIVQVTSVVKPASLAARAAKGDAQAELALGMKLMNGKGVPVDAGQAAVWLTRAAAKGLPVAQNIAGVLYQTGTGVDADMSRAVRWYGLAASHGNVKAMANLGKLYAGGWRSGTDYVQAAHWLSQAANFGDVDAQFDLAILYERGEGVPRNVVDAFKWYSIAAARGDANAASRASILTGQLGPEELQAAQAAAAAFKPQPVDPASNGAPDTTELASR